MWLQTDIEKLQSPYPVSKENKVSEVDEQVLIAGAAWLSLVTQRRGLAGRVFAQLHHCPISAELMKNPSLCEAFAFRYLLSEDKGFYLMLREID